MRDSTANEDDMIAPGAVALPSPTTRASAPDRVDIIGIGVQKSATSWLFRCLSEHPEIRIAAIPNGHDKELNFFNHSWERGYRWYHQGFEFGNWKTAEFSVLYFHDSCVPARIAAYNPGARLLLSIRNPIDRAFSQHRHEIRRKRVQLEEMEFWSALNDNPSYIEQGLYGRHLEEWLHHFDLDQILVVDYADIQADPLAVMDQTYRFVGVTPGFRPQRLDQRVNVSVMARSDTVKRYLRATSSAVRTVAGPRAVELLKNSPVGRYVREKNLVEVNERFVTPLSAEERQRLREYFADDIDLLGKLLGRDFAHWT